ncbi:MAG: FadR/GntR family transcriptional regulator [Actinomycetota bacterium]|nr:FadR/GntR family transcriptional regulator [Actinomycetota bacterium]
MFEPVKRVKTSEQVLKQIQARIFDGTYKAGDRLPSERELSLEMGVNRNTLREALKKLEHMGLVITRQGDGTRVLDFYDNAGIEVLGSMLLDEAESDGRVIDNLFEAREMVGKALARSAALYREEEDLERLRAVVEEITSEMELQEVQRLEYVFFHELAVSSHNLFYIFMVNSIKKVYMSFRDLYAATSRDTGKIQELLASVVEAVERGSAGDAVKAMRKYLSYGKRLMFKTLKMPMRRK